MYILNLIGSVIIDFRKAFDFVNHDVISKWLQLYICSADILSWIKQYLTNIKQFLSLSFLKIIISAEQANVCDVLQG